LKIWIGLNCLRIWFIGELLWTWWWSFRYHKNRKFLDLLTSWQLLKETPVYWISYLIHKMCFWNSKIYSYVKRMKIVTLIAWQVLHCIMFHFQVLHDDVFFSLLILPVFSLILHSVYHDILYILSAGQYSICIYCMKYIPVFFMYTTGFVLVPYVHVNGGRSPKKPVIPELFSYWRVNFRFSLYIAV
jgi:hypothetical protein